ncbi:polysaccharide biosynthesis protein GumE [Luteimonas kalidii]|uniref:Polysaccharide biosynthesis protein GumE n=1 Tax=Luteimonas kalidii TaxID=3042025 RepID=A0ABT6JXZ1_9GAMM|nr:polysaccharide biosynthesis protein GumE [Luteimonas kalidii]MDH5835569.1 polysaccharide biosynthesis protein GumE [Luteimonas kalidii]
MGTPASVHAREWGAAAAARRPGRWRDRAIEAVLLLGIGSGFVLALVNANVSVVRPAMTYALELAIYMACFALGLWRLDRDRAALVVGGLGVLVALVLLRYVASWQFDPKFMRDALIAFAFLVLGAAYRGQVPRLCLWLALLVAVVAAFELAAPQLYGDLVNPKSYFVNARGASAAGFWNEDSNLYVSATRPNARNFLASSELPRASSIFVEPVTMGNFIIFLAAVVLAFGRRLAPLARLAAFALVLFLVVASDGRLAAGTCVLMLLVAPVFARLDQRMAFAVFAAVLLAGAGLVHVAGVEAFDDTMLGRIFFSVQSIEGLSLRQWLGLEPGAAYRYFDSGIAYFIASQSLPGVIAFALGYSFLLILPGVEGRLFKHLAIFAFALSLLVSNGYFSIKTAALWWFVCGWAWQARPRLAAPGDAASAGTEPQR